MEDMNSWNLFVDNAEAIASSIRKRVGDSDNSAHMHINGARILRNMVSGFDRRKKSRVARN